MSALPYLPETIPGKAQCPPLGKAQLIHRGTTQLCLDLECVNIHTMGFPGGSGGKESACNAGGQHTHIL